MVFNLNSLTVTRVLSFRLRDYHDELKPILDVLDPSWKIEDLSMWAENLPAVAQQTCQTSQLVATDHVLDKLASNSRKLQYEADALALARDAAQLARLYGDVMKTSRASRLLKVQHLRQENQIGSTLVAQFMDQSCNFVRGPLGDLATAAAKAFGSAKLKSIIIKNVLGPS